MWKCLAGQLGGASTWNEHLGEDARFEVRGVGVWMYRFCDAVGHPSLKSSWRSQAKYTVFPDISEEM